MISNGYHILSRPNEFSLTTFGYRTPQQVRRPLICLCIFPAASPLLHSSTSPSSSVSPLHFSQGVIFVLAFCKYSISLYLKSPPALENFCIYPSKYCSFVMFSIKSFLSHSHKSINLSSRHFV